MLLKQWIVEEAQRTRQSENTIWRRWRVGEYAARLLVQRKNARVIYVLADAGEGIVP